MNRNSGKKLSQPRPLLCNQKEGFMEKKTGLFSMWKNRYFVLMHDVLSYFKREEEKESMTPTGRVFFSDILTIEKTTKKGRPFCFIITEEEKKHIVSCSSDTERDSWIEAIKSGKDHHSKQEKFDPIRRKSARIGKDLKRITIQKDEGGGIGCTIKNVGGSIFVNRIIQDGPVAISGVLRPGDQVVDINGIKISGSPIEKIKQVIKESPDYVVCTVKPVTHYANQDSSPTLPRTAYTEVDAAFIKSLQDDKDRDAPKQQTAHTKTVYANAEISAPKDFEAGKDDRADHDYVNVYEDKPSSTQNYAELDFSRR